MVTTRGGSVVRRSRTGKQKLLREEEQEEETQVREGEEEEEEEDRLAVGEPTPRWAKTVEIPDLPKNEKGYTMAEPHAKRRHAILDTHPEVRDLFGPSVTLKYATAFLFALHWTCGALAARYLWETPWAWWALAYIVGGTISSSLTLAIHEISHNHAFETPWLNRVIGLFSDAALLVPMSASFRHYHLLHHTYQGVVGVDVDLPTDLECKIFVGPIGKLAWLILQPVFYIGRPLVVRPKKVEVWDVASVITVAIAGYIMYTTLGWKPMVYLWASVVFGSSLHPMAGHFVAEHVMIPGVEDETHSYYGPLNFFAFNVGYHNEHHDFPQVACDKLPTLKEAVPSVYEIISEHQSWVGAMYRFVVDPDMTLQSRATRDKR